MGRRIFIGPVEISGYFKNVAYGMRALGEDVTFVTFLTHHFGYGGENRSCLVDIIKWLSSRRAKTPRRLFFKKTFWVILNEIALVAYFVIAALKYDIFIFGFGQSLLRGNLDLPILRLLGKRIIFNMASGAELRPPYIDGAYHDGNGRPSLTVLKKLTNSSRSRIRKIEKYANVIIVAPYTSHFSSCCMVNSMAIGFPFSVEFSNNIGSVKKEPIRVLHSPSNPVAKGTEVIRVVVNRLIDNGYNIDYIELIGRSNADVLEALKNCDFVIDQLYSDTPLAGFANEAAWFGKPAVVGGYGLRELRNYVPEGMFPPSQICHPDDLEAAVEQLIVDPVYRENLGEEARDFVKSKWSSERVAERYLRLINDDVPDSWILDPVDVSYLHGAGLSENRVKENIAELVQEYGVAVLQLSHRPDLERAFIEFSGLGS